MNQAVDIEGPVARRTALRCNANHCFVIGVWLGMAAALFAFVYAFGSPFPYFDDIAILASWANEGTATWEWFFRPWNGHVIPFERMALVGFWMLTDGNLRPLLLCSASLIVIACVWVLADLKRMTGTLSPEDCLIPLALLGCHSYSDAIWAIMWYNLLAAGLTAMIASSILRSGSQVTPRGVACLSAATGLLAFQGGPGILGAAGFVPALTLLAWRATRSRTAGTFAIVAAMVLLVALVAGLLAYGILTRPHLSRTDASPQSLVRYMMSMVRPLSLAAGWLSLRMWPLGVLLLGVALGAVLWGALRKRAGGPEATLVALTLLPGLLVCAGMAASRNGLVQTRYIGMIAPLWVPIHFGMHMVCSAKTRHLISLATVMALAMSFGYGLTHTVKEGRSRARETRALQAGINEGRSCDQLAAAHGHAWGRRSISSQFSENLAAISGLGRGPIARIPALPTLAFTMAATAPNATGDLHESAGRWECNSGGVMHIELADEKIDAVRLVIDAAVGNYGLEVGLGASRTDSRTWRTASYELRMIYPDEETGPGERRVYTVTYLLPPDATSVVLVAPTDCHDLSLRSVAYGRLSYEPPVDRPR